jgi:hypothetical protein
MKANSLSLFLVPLLIYFSLSPTARAVTPAPDGSYPGGNTAEGQNALFSLTSGGYNTAVGWFSLGAIRLEGLTRGLARAHFLPTRQMKTQLSAEARF